MTRLLTSGIIFLVVMLGLFIYYEIQGRQKLNNVPDPAASLESKESNAPVSNTHHITHDEQAHERKHNTETSRKTETVVLEGEGIDDDVALFENLQSIDECCDEEPIEGGVAQGKRRTARERLIEKHGDPEMVDRYLSLVRKLNRREQLTMDEFLERLSLAAIFEPTKSNITAYKNFKGMIEKGYVTEGSWHMEWRD